MRVEFTGPRGVRGAGGLTRLEKDQGRWRLGGPRDVRMEARPPSKVWDWMLPKSRLPGPLSPSSPAHNTGRAPGEAERRPSWRRWEGRRRGSCTRPTHCGSASSALPPSASPSFPPPSVCLPLALSVCRAAPRLPATSSTRSRPLLAVAKSRRAPAWPARAAARGPLSGGPSVRRRGPGTQSAAEHRGAG